jgi:hypothetical protein
MLVRCSGARGPMMATRRYSSPANMLFSTSTHNCFLPAHLRCMQLRAIVTRHSGITMIGHAKDPLDD